MDYELFFRRKVLAYITLKYGEFTRKTRVDLLGIRRWCVDFMPRVIFRLKKRTVGEGLRKFRYK